MSSDYPTSNKNPGSPNPPGDDGADGLDGVQGPQPLRRSVLITLSTLLGTSLLPGMNAYAGDEEEESDDDRDENKSPEDVTVRFRNVEGAALLTSRFAGLSYEKDKLTQPLYNPANLPLIQLFRLLGPGVLRIGANAVDRSSWNGVQKGLTPILPTQIDDLAGFLDATNWQVIYGINMARNTPENASSEAAYVAMRLRRSLLAWEIGNEPDLYRRLDYRAKDWNYDDYLREWRRLRDAVSAVSPGVPFSGPATAYNLPRFTLPFARDEGERLFLLTHHYYRADRDDPNSTLELLLEPDPTLARDLYELVTAARKTGVLGGVRIAEANSFYGGGAPNISNAFGTALWVIDFLFNCAIAGCSGVNMHSGGSGPGYTPISEERGVVIEARPAFYGMFLFSQAAQGMPMTSIVRPKTGINLSAWGVRRTDGGFNAILMNKDARRSVRMKLATNVDAHRFDPVWLRGRSLSAPKGLSLNGIAIHKEGTWARRIRTPLTASDGKLTVVLPPASALLLRSF